MAPIKSVTGIGISLQQTIAGCEQIFSFLDTEEVTDTGSKTLAHVKGNIIFDCVHFAYKNNPSLLKNYSITIPAGKKTAIVGQSGSGKSTLINLLPRFYEIQSGKITLDGIDITELTLDNLRQQFSYVGQEPLLFRGTILENITYGCNTDYSKAQLQRVLDYSYVSEFIDNMPQGLHTCIGDAGNMLSGGQK